MHENIQSLMRFRSQLNREVRSFFDSRGYIECETPSLCRTPIPEAHIELFSTTYYSTLRGSRELYLIPSPELFMKQLIARGSGSIYQISNCFRNDEQAGSHHNPEFSMLEWYAVQGSSKENIETTEELFRRLGRTFPQEYRRDIQPPFRRMSMAEAFDSLAGIDLDHALRQHQVREVGERAGITIPEGESEADSFHRIFLSQVEPRLPQDKPLVLYDYPSLIPALAEKKGSGLYRSRWELYARGIEIANCYQEERNPALIQSFFRSEYALKSIHARNLPDIDPDFPALFRDFPVCSGTALGMDRLAMLFRGCSSIEGVILFPLSAMLS